MLTPQDPHGAPSVGARLSAARNAKGLSLSDAERQTRIARRFLQAMEADQFDVLPAPVYARGFLRNYARFLGLDEKELLAGVSLAEQRPHVLPVVTPRSNPFLWVIAGVAFGTGVLLWVLLGLGVLGSIEGLIDDIDLDGEPAAPTPIVATQTPTLNCDELQGRESLTAEEQAFFSANCATPTPPGPTPVPDRTSCDEIRGTDYRSDAERSFFLENCLTPTPG